MKRIASYKLQLVREGSHLYETKTITGSDDATAILASWFKDEPYEHCTVMCLNIKGGVIAIQDISVGSSSASVVEPRSVFAPAILHNAASIIVAHNHPSGVSTPSKEDIDATRRLVEAGKILNIPVLDHIIIGIDTELKSSTSIRSLDEYRHIWKGII